ncbi:retinoid-inducible serine carboxypeptidase-like [Haliotis rubra]|uniref:retinoid-inducible serine carboxypeptidase-like n=1 Tax=Haliotis rubra TaxID=36100 RepID=UPI001EE514F4|nr:retinoid-inducible serine carboxypeptidase-like [Haliotis rubra]
MEGCVAVVVLAVVFGCVSTGYVGNDVWMRYSAPGGADQEWAYVDVRPGAHMFYWLYRTTSPSANAPLVMWLQGGPGGSSTGFGNFEEIGPLDVQQQPRNTSWLSAANLLFVDNPVGTGFSYVDNDDAYTTDVQMIAADLLTTFQAFLKKAPEFQSVPFYVFTESYGGKMTSAFAQVLYKAIQSKSVTCDFRGVALGDSWISPIDSVLAWGPYLYTNSLVDQKGLAAVKKAAQETAVLVHQGQWVNATVQWGITEDVVEKVTNGVNFYNILDWAGSEQLRVADRQDLTYIEKLYARHVAPLQAMTLDQLMNGPVREKLKIIPRNVTWGGQSGMVFVKQRGSLFNLVPVEYLVNETPLKVVVYSGQLDLIVETLGTEAWVYRLKIADMFREATRKPILTKGVTNGFVKTAKNFSFYWILKAGHMVPADNGETALLMMRQITGQS